MSEDTKILEDIGQYKYGFHDRDDNYVFKSERGLSREVVENISRMKKEPQWMLEFRLKALEHYRTRPMPNWGPSLKALDFENIYYYVKPTEKSEKSLAEGMRYVHNHYAEFDPDHIATYVRTNYSMEAIGTQLCTLMEKLINNKKN